MMAEPNSSQIMLILKALDSDASIRFSEYTGQWYVDARIGVSDGVIEHSCAEHAASIDAAIRAMFARLTDIDLDHYVVAKPFGRHRRYRWNGAAFAETPDQPSPTTNGAS